MRVPRYRLRPRLAAAAHDYAAAGWPVAPGAWWDPSDERYRCAQPDCVTHGLHPTVPDPAGSIARRCQVTVTQACTRDLEAVADHWSQHPYSVLLPTGDSADAVEFRPATARRVQAVLAAYEQLGPTATFADGRVLLLVAVAGPLDAGADAELSRAGALHHSGGSWVPLPPSRLAAGPISWTRSPHATHWRLPTLRSVVGALRRSSLAPPADAI